MIIIKHILPNTLSPITVQATFICASAIITEAYLSFIGAGTPPIIPSWGNMISEAQNGDLYTIAWWFLIFPFIALFLTTLAFNLLGDGLRDALDPRMKTV